MLETKSLLFDLPPYVRFVFLEWLEFADVLKLDIATIRRFIVSTSPLWILDRTFCNRFAMKWVLERHLNLDGYSFKLNESSRRHNFVLLPTFHQLCLEGNDSLPIAVAIANGFIRLHDSASNEEGFDTKVVKQLVDSRATYGDPGNISLHSQTALHTACSGGSLNTAKCLILEMQADVNVKDDWEATPLHNAASKGHSEIVALLLEHGANVNAQRLDGDTALHLAVRAGHQSCVLLLIAWRANPAVCNVVGLNALHAACESNQPECVTTILRCNSSAAAGIIHSVDYEGNTVLHTAFHAGNAAIAAVLIASGAQPQAKNLAGVTALDVALKRIADMESWLKR